MLGSHTWHRNQGGTGVRVSYVTQEPRWYWFKGLIRGTGTKVVLVLGSHTWHRNQGGTGVRVSYVTQEQGDVHVRNKRFFF